MQRSIRATAFLNDLEVLPKSNLMHNGASRRLVSWSFTSAVGRDAIHVDIAKCLGSLKRAFIQQESSLDKCKC